MNLLKQDYLSILDYYNINYSKNLPINLLRKMVEDKLAKKENDDLLNSQGFQENKIGDTSELPVPPEPKKQQIKLTKSSLFLLRGRSN